MMPSQEFKPRTKIIDPKLLSLRPVAPDDDDFLYQVFASTRIDELRFVDWDDRQKEALVRMQFGIQRQQYEGGYPEAEHSIILVGDHPAGRMFVGLGEHEMTLVDIALLPEHRSSGIGTYLIQKLLNRAAEAGKPLRLHVLKSNPAQRLYERLGFVRVAEDGMYFEMLCEPRVDVNSK